MATQLTLPYGGARSEGRRLGLKVLTRTLSVLQSVAGAIANALDTLLIIIKQEALAVFSPITSAINDAMSSSLPARVFLQQMRSGLHCERHSETR